LNGDKSQIRKLILKMESFRHSNGKALEILSLAVFVFLGLFE